MSIDQSNSPGEVFAPITFASTIGNTGSVAIATEPNNKHVVFLPFFAFFL